MPYQKTPPSMDSYRALVEKFMSQMNGGQVATGANYTAGTAPSPGMAEVATGIGSPLIKGAIANQIKNKLTQEGAKEVIGDKVISSGLEGLGYGDSASTLGVESSTPTGFSLGGVATNLGSLGPYAGAGVGAGVLGGIALGAKGLKDLLQGNKTKGAEGWGGRATLGIATGGLSELARPFFGHKSTKQYQAERWGNVGNQNAGWADVYNKVIQPQQAGDGIWTAKDDPTGKYVGKKWSFDAARDIAKTTGNYLGFDANLGNAQTFGDKWHTLKDDQRKNLLKALVDNNLYSSNKGDILINDKAKAQQYWDQIVGGKPQVAVTKPSTTANTTILDALKGFKK